MEKGYIYKIYDNTNQNMYYGSTVQTISMRMCGHRADYKKFMEKGNGCKCKSFEILKNGDYSYSLVEQLECDSKLILHQRERYYIENNDCVNKNIPSRTTQESHKQWREANKEKRKESHKQWREANKEQIKEKGKQYREANKKNKQEYDKANKNKIKEYQKQYKKEEIECECGCIFRKDNLYKHRKTKKHLNNLKAVLCST